MQTRRSRFRVTVVVPVFWARYLGEALASIAAQRRPADEVIVIDDGSPDRRVIRALAAAHPGVVLIEQENKGAAAARNAGVRAASGDLIAFLDADDAWYPELLSEQLRLMNRTAADLVYSDAHLVDTSNRRLGRFMENAPSAGTVTLESLLSQSCTVLTSSVVVRREILFEAGLFDESIRRGQDFDLWLRLAHRDAVITYQRRALLTRRVHPVGLSGTPVQELDRALAVLDKAAMTLPLTPRQREILARRRQQISTDRQRELGKEWVARGRYEAARECLSRAHAASPGWKLRATLVGLRVAPWLLRGMVLARQPGLATPTTSTEPALDRVGL